ncbi:two-component sensor histidine kinase [Hydrogenophaga crassostreae]|uniref:histidine kinase n=1 Tax=Hydrogenophaga crassostreae TaxID=1763535 RepID=A0A167GLQ9_9BURK|nr:ATP-binding protein [Hydrogenophaga crassostreae]AOW14796.1 two-component sensor histidine kinase [Hydrogenophaga crassostreae]OAD39625.1 two-component sensor histidine kinase [Hydrogenophaga crassostreae]
MKAATVSPYEEQLSDFRVTYSKAGAITTALLVLVGISLDFFSYPDRLTEFLLFRIGTALAIFLVFVVLYTNFGRTHVRALTMIWLSMPQLMIAWMIYLTDGSDSIYFVGLHLAMYAVGIILPITVFEGIGFGALTLVVYVIACAYNENGAGTDAKMYTNSIFILFSATASAVCTWFNEKARNRLFSLQHEVSLNNKKLKETNRTLAEVKGQLIQREKMAAIGTLSAGLLHELNNPVNYSLMAINMAMTLPTVKTDAMLKESLVDAKEGMDRIQNIVSDLKTFAYQKPGEDSHRPFLLENAVRSATRLAGFDLKGIKVSVDLPQDTHVLGDEPAIIGVLINLLSNAAHAVHGAKREQPDIGVRVESLEKRLKVSVRDNGQGIATDVLSRVFEPFFTTREVGSGLGLGLSMSYSIIQRHGSTLEVHSEPGAWTEFTFDLART